VWALAKEMQRSGHEVRILIPLFGESGSREYEYDGLKVIQYGEPSVVNREFLLAQRPPEGLASFLQFVKQFAPDAVHFHEFNASNGITIYHSEAVRSLQIHTFMTMHLPGYTCRTDRLMYMGKELCNGLINPLRCAKCWLNDHLNNPILASGIYAASIPLFGLNINTSRLNNRLGTSLAFPFFIDELKRRLDKIAASVDRIIVLTHWYKEILKLNGIPDNKISFVGQGLPYNASSGDDRRPPEGDIVRLIFIGRIDPFKGVHLLLEAMAGLAPERITLDIYGQVVDEDYYRKCRELSKELPSVSWKGVIEQDKVIPTLASYHALCLPSTFSEMSPIVIQEAFAAGIPVIGSNVYGIAEPVKDGVNGLLFKFNDSLDLRKVLAKVINDPALLKGLAANVTPPDSFSEVAKAMLEIYESVLCQNQ